MSEVLIKEYRGNIVENVHCGSIAIVSSTGDTIAYLGDIEKQTFMRSASKPIQVLPTLLAGLHRRFNLTEEDVAMFNSSHWGSNHHIFVLEEIARKTGLTPENMIMKPCTSTSASPLAAKLTDKSRLHPRMGQSKLQHCCSGKHFSLMLLQRELTGKPDGYHLKDSPVQQQILNFISMLSQTPTYKIGLGIDGCGVPVFALPLRSIAMSYAKLMDPFSMSEELQKTIDFNFSCIHKYPEKINDYGTPSYYINQNPDLIMKDGSRGVICMAIKSMKLGIAVKLEDGWTDEFQGLIIASILEQLKYDDPGLIATLRNCYTTKLYNDCGIEVGHSEADFQLNIDPAFFEPAEDAYVDPDAESEQTDGSFADPGSEITEDDAQSDLSDDPEPDSTAASEDKIRDNTDNISKEINVDGDTESGNETNAEADTSTGIENEGSDKSGSDDKDDSFDSKIATAYDKVSRATEEADDDSVIDAIIEREDQKPDPEKSSISEEEQRAIRNKKSILGMTIVKPSTKRTFISNPRVDPINVRPEQHSAAPVSQQSQPGQAEQTPHAVPVRQSAPAEHNVFSPFSAPVHRTEQEHNNTMPARTGNDTSAAPSGEPESDPKTEHTGKTIKLANILSQKKRDE